MYTMKDHYTKSELEKLVKYTGNEHLNLIKVLKFLDPNNTPDYGNWKRDTTFFEVGQTNCVCGHQIKNIFRAYHTETKMSIDIGSKCIGKFSKSIRLSVNREIRMRLALAKDPELKYCKVCSKRTPKSKFILYKMHNYHFNCFNPIKSQFTEEELAIFNTSMERHSMGLLKMNFGKYRGTTLSDIHKLDIGYLKWISKNFKPGKILDAVNTILDN